MKKHLCFLLSAIILFSLFSFLSIDSFALVSVEPETTGFSNGTLRFDASYGGDLCVWQYDFVENSAYNRSGMCVFYLDSYNGGAQEQWMICDVYDLLNGIQTNQEPFGYYNMTVTRISDDNVRIDSPNNSMFTTNTSSVPGYPFTVTVNTIFTTDFAVFASSQKAIDYYRYGLKDEETFRYGGENIKDTTFESIEYDPLEIPAPNVEWVADSNGNFTHELHFLNNGYFGEHNTQLNYGLLLSMHWLSVNKGIISIYQTQLAYTRYQFTSTDFCLSDEVKVYQMPMGPFNFSDYECPPYLNLDTNGLCINGFNQLLSAYPVNSREFTSSSNQSNANFVLNTIKSNLDDIDYKLNCPVVSCQYFIVNEDNEFVKGPITKLSIKFPNPVYFNDTGADLGYDQSEIQNINPETNEPITPPVVINPPSSPNPGPQDPYQVPSYEDVNARDLVDNMGSLFDFVGQVPMFMAKIFSFLPQWIIVFIAVAIGLMVAIGVVKLFLG